MILHHILEVAKYSAYVVTKSSMYGTVRSTAVHIVPSTISHDHIHVYQQLYDCPQSETLNLIFGISGQVRYL